MIIGLAGKIGSGKTTVADYLVQKYGFKKINFKDALIDELKEKMPDLLQVLADEQATKLGLDTYPIDRLFIEKPAAIRALMQNYGTEVRRGDNERYWVDKFMDKLRRSDNKDFVIDDVRFLNEHDTIKSLGWLILLKKMDEEDTISTHRSEIEVDWFKPDYTVVTRSGEHELLYEAIDDIVADES